jgi:AcrR family transcriptional regulator
MGAMTPRPRLTSDESILAGAARAIGRLGPARLTLADVAREVGVSPATLIQRFGSKRGLLLALASAGAEGNRQEFTALRRAHSSPTAALLAMADCMTQFFATPEEISNGLAFLQIDLTDPEFHHLALASAQTVDAEIRKLIADALKAGELAGCQPARLARVLQAALHGSLVSWAIHRKGALRDWLRKDLETVLQPYRKPRAGGAPRRRR